MQMTEAKQKLVHLLITVDLGPRVRMHSYVICPEENERVVLERVADRMLTEAEKNGLQPWPGIFLSTKLGDAAGVVQGVLDEHYPKARKHFNKVKDFHLTMWAMATSDPCDSKLMQLH
jgi:hypothetical protein